MAPRGHLSPLDPPSTIRGEVHAALAAKPHPGRTPFLTPAREKQVLGWRADKPTARGFRTDLWTARRVAQLVRARVGVAFHPHDPREGRTNRDYTPPKPMRRPGQRDEAAIAGWLRNDWPHLQKKSPRNTPTSS